MDVEKKMKNILYFQFLLIFLLFTGNVCATTVGTFGELNNWVTSASRLSGTDGALNDTDPVAALVGDDLTDGAINIDSSNKFQLNFSSGIKNNSGADLVIFDAQFSADSVFVEINGVENLILNTDFIDSGLDFTLKNSTYVFSLFGASLDLSNWGISTGNSIFSINIRGDEQSDIMGVSGMFAATSVPVPAVVWLFGFGLFVLIGVRKNSPKTTSLLA